MDYKKILIFIFQILIRILGFGLLILGLSGLPTLFSNGGVTTNIITLLLRLANYLSQIIVGYGLVRMKKWSIFGLIVLIIISILIPFHNLYISTTPNIPQQSLSFSRTVFFIIVYLITLIFKNELFSKENEIVNLKISIADKYKIIFKLIGICFLLTGVYVFSVYFFSGNFLSGGKSHFFFIPSTLRFFNVFIGIVIGVGLIGLKKWSIYLLVLKLFLSVIDPVYFYNFYVSPFLAGYVEEFNFGDVAFFFFDMLIDIAALFFLTSLIKKSNKSQDNFEESEKLNNFGENQQNRYGYLYKFSIFTATVVVACLLMIFVKNYNLAKSMSLTTLDKKTIPTPTEVKEKRYSKTDVKRYKIVDTNQDPPLDTSLHMFVKANAFPTNLFRWKNYLIEINKEYYVDKSSSSSEGLFSESTELYCKVDSIQIYNLDSKESFEIKLDEPIIEDHIEVIGQIFENKFYLGFIEAGIRFNYSLDLPPSSKSKIIELPNSVVIIKKFGNTYTNSFCLKDCYYSLLDINTGKTTELTRINEANTSYDEERTEKMIGIDSKARAIFNSLKENIIVAVPITNEKLTIPLIKKDKLPIDVVSFSMIDEIDKILMLGENKAYIYDINRGTFKEIQINQEADNWKYYWKNNNYICLSSETKIEQKTTYSAVDMATNEYLEDAPNDCWHKDKTDDEIIKDLNLPDNYQFKDDSLTFETYWKRL